MQAILHEMTTAADAELIGLLAALIRQLRPARARDGRAAINGVQALCYLLELHPEYRQALRRALLHLISSCRQVPLYTETGILSNETFFATLRRRIGERLLPPVPDPQSLKDRFGEIFSAPDDHEWLAAVPREHWYELGRALHFDEERDRDSIARTRLQMLEAIQILSCRLAAIGLEPEIVRNCPEVQRFESPFVHQNIETLAYIERYRAAMIDATLPKDDDAQILVLLDQCEAQIAKVRRSAARQGVSVSLTYLLIRIRQHIERIKLLLDLIDPDGDREAHAERLLTVMIELVRAENRKHRIRDVFSENTELLALQVTDHASRTGEHYIAESRREWVAMFKSAAGAGFIVGFMSLFKLLTGKAHLPLLLEALAFGLNYALGFMLIHMLHFTIATKQPAMTAAKIAASIHQQSAQGGRRQLDLDELALLIVKVIRTQFIAILGNVLIVMPFALGIALAWKTLLGVPVVDAAKAQRLLHDLSPIASLALFHAGIAGVCLFLAGLISGYYDNKSIYNKIPDRVAALPWLNRLIGERRTRRLAGYIEHNLGALAGNFYFGMMLGTIGTIGVLVGLPVDIRHITFSSAYLSYAAVSFDFQLDPGVVLISLAGIALIGLTNLAVSFGLALWVALRSRKLNFRATRPLLGKLVRHFLTRPGDFLLPPRAEAPLPEPVAPAEAPPDNLETVRDWIRRRRR
ncbi:site-specific recombinase [Chitiniphilus purpureus]|uniref:Site-specific recombinase n=1 Tax=Chitiniphilus purpureus TaxID=2981137 RepID=A0ABY6DNF8_9NEIS|nr:site-specific recombinase [Chitiniphilus sp. CD1]UXY15905.1 site-specific recombinase [Chitiniphilus sp. CD1]